MAALYRIRRRDLALIGGLAVGQALALVVFLLAMASLIDVVQLNGVIAGDSATLSQLLRLLAIMAGAGLAHGVFRAVEFAAAERIGYRVVQDLRMRMHAHLQGMQPRQIQNRSRGGLLLRFLGDLSMLRTWISRGLLGGLSAAIAFVIFSIVMLVVAPWVGVAMAVVVLAGAAASIASGDTVRRATRTMRRRRSLLASNIDEQINALQVVQVNGRSAGEHARLSRQNDSLTRALLRVAGLRGRLRGIADATALLTVVAVLGVGLLGVYRGTLTVGLVFATTALSRQLTAPIRTAGLAHDYWQRSRVSVTKISDFLTSRSTQLDPPGAERLRARKGRIEFADVTVPGALQGLTATAGAGRVIGITGPSGAGKSTLLGLVARSVQAESGSVIIDDQDLSSVSPASTFRRIGMVSADQPLMRGTVRRNVTYRMPGADPQEIGRVVLATALDEMLADLPGGLNAWVTEGGRNLSVGQRQRIALARALMGNPQILLLDEPTANLDERGRESFRRTLASFQGTTLLVTHDPAELALADEVWVMEGGRVAQTIPGGDYRSDPRPNPPWAGSRVA